ncbi:MAG: hypothetical protein RLZZ127_1898, partial [Planctomycetota bacterium]
SLCANYGRQPLRLVRGEGVWLVDDRGRRLIDGFAGVAVSSLGHAHPALVAAISEQAATLLHVSNHYHHPWQEDLSARLAALSGLDRVFFCNSGTEANEAAHKLMRLHGRPRGRMRLVCAVGGFHGRSLGALSWTHNPAYREPFAPLPGEVAFVPYGDSAALERMMADDVAMVALEPIQGEGGVHVPPDGYLASARALCDRHGALLCLDEVQTGIGRTGRMFGYQRHGIRPDIVTLAKGLGGGVPVGAVAMTQAVADLLKPGLHGTTFGGNPLACRAALAVLDVVGAPGFLDAVAARGRRLAAGLAALFPGCPVRGEGLLLGVGLGADPTALIQRGFDAGVVVGPASGNTLRLAPPLIISDGEIDELLARLARAKG